MSLHRSIPCPLSQLFLEQLACRPGSTALKTPNEVNCGGRSAMDNLCLGRLRVYAHTPTYGIGHLCRLNLLDDSNLEKTQNVTLFSFDPVQGLLSPRVFRASYLVTTGTGRACWNTVRRMEGLDGETGRISNVTTNKQHNTHMPNFSPCV